MNAISLSILLQAYYSVIPHADCKAKVGKESLKYLEEKGLIYRSDVVSPETTAKGKAYIRMILQMPMPEQVFVNPLSGERIETP